MMRAFERRLLDWLVRLNPTSEPLYGDLCEELACGRSHAWFFEQLLHAAGTAAARHAWKSKRRAAERLALDAGIAGVLLFAIYVTVTLGVTIGALVWRAIFS